MFLAKCGVEPNSLNKKGNKNISCLKGSAAVKNLHRIACRTEVFYPRGLPCNEESFARLPAFGATTDQAEKSRHKPCSFLQASVS
ncbi:MAG: hypothetical protein D6704_02965 [Nitrospirae bacterium]|nr:MAG: hypothetical protein D6704_02965 [Nitrospirota bacterium]